MSRFLEPVWIGVAMVSLASMCAAQPADKFPGIGRTATPKEVAAWDIDVRPDFKGLPAGSGSVAQGQDIWEAKCASCHGVFGESNSVFTPLVGGTTADDVKTGRVASLKDNSYPGRTTLMKVSTLSTLWDYINRAMPWNQPKSLTTDEVYAVTAFLLNLGGVVPDDYTLSDRNMAETQARMPNRNGMTLAHGLWPGSEFNAGTRPDINVVACMINCATDAKVASLLPDYARNAHGNLADQNRMVGAQHGAQTLVPENQAAANAVRSARVANASVVPKKDEAGSGADGKAAFALATKYSCTACHGINQKIVGPAFTDVAKKYPGRADYIADKIKSGGTGVWGPVPMPPQTLSTAEAKLIASWIAGGATK